MHAFDDEVSYTRIIDPEPAGDDLVIPAKGERPSLVWRPRLGEDQTYELTGRLTKLGRHDGRPYPRATRPCGWSRSGWCSRTRAA